MLPELAAALDQGGYGPAMMALTDRQRAFVIYMFQTGMRSAAAGARAAGAPQGPHWDGVHNTVQMRRAGHLLLHHPKVQAAMLEYGKGAFRAAAPKAIEMMQALAFNGKTEQIKLAATREILDRGGFAPTVNVDHKHTVTISYDEKVNRLKELVRLNGGDPDAVVAGLAAPVEPEATDAEYEEVEE